MRSKTISVECAKIVQDTMHARKCPDCVVTCIDYVLKVFIL